MAVMRNIVVEEYADDSGALIEKSLPFVVLVGLAYLDEGVKEKCLYPVPFFVREGLLSRDPW